MEQIAHLIQQLDEAREAMRAAIEGLDTRMSASQSHFQISLRRARPGVLR
jgi:hypothetical protein